jgi:hypothetical protein
MGNAMKAMRYLVWLTQLGLSVCAPLVGFILLGVWLHNSRGWGGWTVPVGIALGLMGAAGGLVNSFRTLHRMSKADEDKPSPGYNKHE